MNGVVLVYSLQGVKHDLLNITFHGVLVSGHSKQDLITSVLLFPVRIAIPGSRDVFGGSSQELGHEGVFLGVGYFYPFPQFLDERNGGDDGD